MLLPYVFLSLLLLSPLFLDDSAGIISFLPFSFLCHIQFIGMKLRLELCKLNHDSLKIMILRVKFDLERSLKHFMQCLI